MVSILASSVVDDPVMVRMLVSSVVDYDVMVTIACSSTTLEARILTIT
jgi:hypothetical protein